MAKFAINYLLSYFESEIFLMFFKEQDSIIMDHQQQEVGETKEKDADNEAKGRLLINYLIFLEFKGLSELVNANYNMQMW